jgi:hypothetical protein
MRTAVIADIRVNLEALQAVLERIRALIVGVGRVMVRRKGPSRTRDGTESIALLLWKGPQA